MSISNSVVTLSTGVAVALHSVAGQILDVYMYPTTTIYIGGSGVTSSGGGIPVTTGTAAPEKFWRVPAGSVLYAAPASSSAITVAVMTRSL
ncbi:MAG: hypothetical protein ACM3NQ_04290 [Bacteroidales bacterium]